jgi:hypothetical protein
VVRRIFETKRERIKTLSFRVSGELQLHQLWNGEVKWHCQDCQSRNTQNRRTDHKKIGCMTSRTFNEYKYLAVNDIYVCLVCFMKVAHRVEIALHYLQHTEAELFYLGYHPRILLTAKQAARDQMRSITRQKEKVRNEVPVENEYELETNAQQIVAAET